MYEWKKYLASIYFDPSHPGSYAGPEKLYKTVKEEGKFKIGQYRIKKWLQDQESYSLTRGARRKFNRARVIVEGLDSQWDMDLMDMVDLAKPNDEYKYVLVCVDIFSRYALCQLIKNKTGANVVQPLRSILSGSRKPKTIRTDRGMEFRSKEVNKYLKGENIHHFYALNTETKANYAERLIKTLKHKIFRYMLKKRTQRYVDILQDVVKSYNTTVHSSLGATPASITKENEGESRLQQYMIRKKFEQKIKPYKLKIGQTVRLSHVRGVFDREYSQKWTGEIFKVHQRFKREGLPVYKLVDWDGDTIEGTFNEPELQTVTVDESTEYHIEKVLKKRVKNKQRQVLVRWLHWPKKYDSWIPENDVIKYS